MNGAPQTREDAHHTPTAGTAPYRELTREARCTRPGFRPGSASALAAVTRDSVAHWDDTELVRPEPSKGCTSRKANVPTIPSMASSGRDDQLRDGELMADIELLVDVIAVVSRWARHLDDSEIDRILGLSAL